MSIQTEAELTDRKGAPYRPIPARKGDLKVATWLSLLVALLMAAVSAAGLALGSMGLYGASPRTSLGATEAEAGLLVPGLLGQDLFNLVVGVPLLVTIMWLVRRGSLAGLLLWPGALFYILYSYVIYLVGAPFSGLFVVYVPLVTLSAYSIISLVSAIDREEAGERFAGLLSARIIGGILIALALLTLAQDTTGALVTALGSSVHTDPVARQVWIADLAVNAPAVLVGGLLLWRRSPLGYVVGSGLLLQYGLTPLGLAAGLALQALSTSLPLNVGTFGGLLTFALICFATLGVFLHGVNKSGPRASLASARSQVAAAQPNGIAATR